MKKTIYAILLTLCLLTVSAMALASQNVTIAVQGRNGFDSYIAGMMPYDGKLLLNSYDTMYVWNPETRELQTLSGLDTLQSQLTESDPPLLTAEEGTDVYLGSEMLSVDGKLYRIATANDEEQGVATSWLVELVIGADGSFSLGEVIELGDALSVDYGDGYVNARSLMMPCTIGRTLYAISYDMDGMGMVALDLDSASLDVLALEMDGNVQSVARFDENRLLLLTCDYEQDPVVSELMLYDVDSEELTLLGSMPTAYYEIPGAIVYDAAHSLLLYTLGGSVYRMPVTQDGLGEPEEFGDMPLNASTDSAALVLGDLYIVSGYDGVIGRDVTTEKLPEQQLTVDNTGYIEAMKKAYFAFTDAHPEYMVRLVSRGTENILQDMLSRSPDVDIYTLNSTDSVFDALLARGFAAQLTSEALSDAVKAMYPGIADACMAEGAVYALPMDGNVQVLTLNKTLLTESFGFAPEELPTTWPQLFDLIAALSDGRMEDVPEATLMDPYYTRDSARRDLFSLMLGDYFLWLDADETHLARGSEVLIACCEAFERIDWDNLGLPQEDETDAAWEYTENSMILTQSSLDLYHYQTPLEPIALAIAEGEEPMLGMSLTLAVVNPFSAHVQEAMAYLEDAFALMDARSRMKLDPSMNEPVLSDYYEEGLKSYDEMIAQLETAVQNTEDEQQREELMQSLEEFREYRAQYEVEGRYEVSAEGIEDYRALADTLSVSGTTLWNTDAYAPVEQYLGGAMNVQQLAAELEKTLQMRMLEGV